MVTEAFLLPGLWTGLPLRSGFRLTFAIESPGLTRCNRWTIINCVQSPDAALRGASGARTPEFRRGLAYHLHCTAFAFQEELIDE